MNRITTVSAKGKAKNFHRNYNLSYKNFAKVKNGNSTTLKDNYNETAQAIQNDIISDCKTNATRMSVRGSLWSLSRAAFNKHRIIDVTSLNIDFEIGTRERHNNYTGQLNNLLFVQCGKTIKSISQTLGRKSKSLKTSGASNGQTITGAISTGVHGSALDIGSVQDMVVGLNIIISDNEIVFLQRKSHPIVNNTFAQSINSRLISDDALFNAALVSLGAFGFIHGVLLEVEDEYLLERHIITVQRAQALRMGIDRKFNDISIPFKGVKPYHYKLYLNPYQPNNDFICEIMYRQAFVPHTNPRKQIRASYFGDIPGIIGKIVGSKRRSAKKFIKKLSKFIIPNPGEKIVRGTLAEIFYDTTTSGSVFGIAFGVDVTESISTLDILVKLIQKQNVPGMISIRYVKGTKANLGFTRFKKTAIIEVDGVQWKGEKKFYKSATDALMKKQIDFTLHWGKNANWNPNLVNYMYTQRIKNWKTQRDKLLNNEMKKVFSNAFLKTTGLT